MKRRKKKPRTELAPVADPSPIAARNGIAEATEQTMTPPNSPASTRRTRGLSISFDPPEARWVDALVALLKEQGYPNAKRSEVVRIALLELQDALAGRTRADIVKHFVQRDATRRMATISGTTPALPSS